MNICTVIGVVFGHLEQFVVFQPNQQSDHDDRTPVIVVWSGQIQQRSRGCTPGYQVHVGQCLVSSFLLQIDKLSANVVILDSALTTTWRSPSITDVILLQVAEPIRVTSS